MVCADTLLFIKSPFLDLGSFIKNKMHLNDKIYPFVEKNEQLTEYERKHLKI